ALALFDDQELIRRDAGQVIFDAAGPLDVDGGRRVFRETERQREIALRLVARSAADDAPLLADCALDADDGADAVAVGLHAAGSDAEKVVPVPAVVAKEVRRTVIGGDEHVEVAVVVDVRVRGAASADRALKVRSDRVAGVLELSLSEIVK